MENFVESFAPPAATAAKAASRVRPASHTNSPAEVVGKGAALHSQVAKGERAAEQNFRSVQSKLSLPIMVQFIGIPVMWLVSKTPLPRVKTVFASVFKASGEALQNTKLRDAFNLPANYMQEVAKEAAEANVGHWATKATTASGKLTAVGASAEKQVGGLASKAGGVLEGVGSSGLGKKALDVVKIAASKVGNTKIFTALLVAGAAAGLGAVAFGARAESKESKAAFKDLMKDLGGDKNSPFAKAIRGTYASKQSMGLAKAGLEMSGEVLNGALFMKQGTVGFGLIAGSMLPQLCTSLIPESPVLGGYVALKKADAGELQLDKAARVDAIRQLVAIMPNVAAHGGQYNRLVTPVAAEIVERKMTAIQVVQLLNNEQAFTALAAEVTAKQKAAHAKAEKPIAAEKAHVKPVAAETSITGKAEAANAPSLKIGAVQHHGKLETQALKLA